MKNNFKIKGAYYYEKESNSILIPYFTGNFNTVDCSIFLSIEDIKESYSDSYINEVIDNPIIYNGVEYYAAEYHPVTVSDWELLSDLSDLEHIEEEYNW